MVIDRERARESLRAFDFRRLFIDQLGWDKYSGDLEIVVGGSDYRFRAISEKRGIAVLVCESIPEHGIRLKLDKLVAKRHFKHLIVFADQALGRPACQCMPRQSCRPNPLPPYPYSSSHSSKF